MNNIVPTTIRIREEIKNAIEDLAKLEKRSFNKMVEYILELYLSKYMEKLDEEDEKK